MRFLLSFRTALVASCAVPALFCNAIACGDEWRKIVPDVVYGHKDGMALTYDVIQPTIKPNRACIIFMVSGGWFSIYIPPEDSVRELPEGKIHPDHPNLFERIVDHGYTLIMLRHGSAPKFKVPDATADVKLAIRHIRTHAEEFGFDPNRIGVCGGSAGGHLSLILGTMGEKPNEIGRTDEERVDTHVQAIVAYFAPTDLRTYVNHETLSKQYPALVFPNDQAESVSPLLAATSDDAPTLLIHGDKDDLVPLWHSEKMIEALRSKNVECELIVMKGAGHGFAGKQGEEAEAKLIAWFDSHLQSGSKESEAAK